MPNRSIRETCWQDIEKAWENWVEMSALIDFIGRLTKDEKIIMVTRKIGAQHEKNRMPLYLLHEKREMLNQVLLEHERKNVVED